MEQRHYQGDSPTKVVPARDGNGITPPSSPSARSALAGFMSENTKKAYANDVRDFFGVEDLGQITLQDFTSATPEQAIIFRDRLLGEGKANATVARKMSALRAFFRNLVARGVMPLNPFDTNFVRSPRKSTVHHTDSLTWEEARALLSAPDRDSYVGCRDYAMLMVALNCGLRRSELCSIRKSDLKDGPSGQFIRVLGKGQKERLIALREDVSDSIAAYAKLQASAEEYLFSTVRGGKMTGSNFWYIVKKYSEKAGITKSIHPHTLRAAFITFALHRGASIDKVQRAAGHSWGGTTLEYARDLEDIQGSATNALEGMTGDADE